MYSGEKERCDIILVRPIQLSNDEISLFLKCLNPLTNFIMLKTINSERGTYFLGEVDGNITFENTNKGEMNIKVVLSDTGDIVDYDISLIGVYDEESKKILAEGFRDVIIECIEMLNKNFSYSIKSIIFSLRHVLEGDAFLVKSVSDQNSFDINVAGSYVENYERLKNDEVKFVCEVFDTFKIGNIYKIRIGEKVVNKLYLSYYIERLLKKLPESNEKVYIYTTKGVIVYYLMWKKDGNFQAFKVFDSMNLVMEL